MTSLDHDRAVFERWAEAQGFNIHRDDSEKYSAYHKATTRWAWLAFKHARELERQDWSRVHHVLAKHGKHPGRVDGNLADVIDSALTDSRGTGPSAEVTTKREAARVRDLSAAWFALTVNAASAIEDAGNCLRDPEAIKSANGAAKHYRAAANDLFSLHVNSDHSTIYGGKGWYFRRLEPSGTVLAVAPNGREYVVKHGSMDSEAGRELLNAMIGALSAPAEQLRQEVIPAA